MFHIVIISGSARNGRQTPKAAMALQTALEAHPSVDKISLIDVKVHDFPVMEERLGKHPNPPPGLEECGSTIDSADAVVIVSPEYNGSFSGALKNTMDYFYKEYRKKPIGVAMVSGGQKGGINASHDVQKYILALGAFPMPYKLLVSDVRNTLGENGEILDDRLRKSIDKFVLEFLWITEAVVTQKKKSVAQ